MSIFIHEHQALTLHATRGDLRAAATLHHALKFRHITTEPLFFSLIPAPMFFEGVECQFHDVRQNITFAFLFNALNEFVQDPRARDELQHKPN